MRSSPEVSRGNPEIPGAAGERDDLPEADNRSDQVPDHVSEIYDRIETFPNGSLDGLGESLGELLGECDSDAGGSDDGSDAES